MASPLRSYRGMWLWLPPASVIGGMLAAAHTADAAISLPKLAAGLALTLGGWLMFWEALFATDWSPLRTWRDWQTSDPLPTWPYLQPHTPGASLYRALAQARAWWRVVGRDSLWHPLRQALVAGVSSLLLAWYIGRAALLLTLFLIAWAELAALWHEGQEPGSGWLTVAWIGLPWLLGGSLIGLPATMIGAAGMLTVLVACYAQLSPWAVVGPLCAAAFLVTLQHPIAAGILLLLSFPGLNTLLYRPTATAYRAVIAPWLLAMLLVVTSVL